ncbi:hypothetical protein IscW_ISCW006978 [Ixodes scapularis]|uniref:Spaetzle domain-containing protein n=1 Tax=Ixodes scapularis TaxID=6945 RepID=B7PSR0_IXOSC|nr:hypothetical protein IscW_ISCW006978 [Ixodes scapularis]|eukprot:XP_002402823.1 hypothetical protein IscW_ISCW006978 [Ixodes scapularis]
MSRCRQKYLKKKLLSLDSDGEGTSEDNFFVPSCCVCELVRDVSKKSPDRSCSSVISLPFGYMSRCRQKYLKKKLLSLDSDGEGTSEDNFFVPSCCVCELVRDVSKK